MSHPVAAAGIDYARRPMLVFWETTRACPLACRHCRASAQLQPLPGQLDPAEGLALVDQVAGFGRPRPVLVFTGGDCLLRADLFDLVDHAVGLGIPVALSPSVSPLLDQPTVRRIADRGVKAVSVSLDGATPATHDAVRGIPGHFTQTVAALRALVAQGLTVQVNTTVMRGNVTELADVARILRDTGVHIWEVFFLVHVGRGTAVPAISPEEHVAVCHLLYDAGGYGFTVRTVEAPFFRRVVAERRAGASPVDSDLYRQLRARLQAVLGPPSHRPRAQTTATRDGKGILFVAHDGAVYPAGFLPLKLGNVRTRPLADIYRRHPLLRAIRAGRFAGRCGRCGYADLCGGSRARAFAATGDPLGEDPACPFPVPA